MLVLWRVWIADRRLESWTLQWFLPGLPDRNCIGCCQSQNTGGYPCPSSVLASPSCPVSLFPPVVVNTGMADSYRLFVIRFNSTSRQFDVLHSLIRPSVYLLGSVVFLMVDGGSGYFQTVIESTTANMSRTLAIATEVRPFLGKDCLLFLCWNALGSSVPFCWARAGHAVSIVYIVTQSFFFVQQTNNMDEKCNLPCSCVQFNSVMLTASSTIANEGACLLFESDLYIDFHFRVYLPLCSWQ